MAEALSAGCIGLLLLLVVADAVAASVFRNPLTWSSDFQSLLLAYALLMPAAYALQQDNHIKVRVLSDRLSHPMQRAVGILTMAAALVAFVALTVKAGQTAAFSQARGWVSHTPFGMPLWWSQVAVFMAGGILCLQILVKLYHLCFPGHSTGPRSSSTSTAAGTSSDRQEPGL
jgi:TRAP-type C4-dicarboxylate transport system permease small subunit